MGSSQPVLVLGAQGQLGFYLKNFLGEKGLGLSRQELDLSNLTQIGKVLGEANPSAVINAAAYTQVDRAEGERDAAFRVNAEAVEVLALECRKKKIPFIHFSTDYVFSGEGTRPWKEEDLVRPLNVYGQSKAEGEKRIAEVGGRWLIFRTSWVYSSIGRNFFRTILKLAETQETLRIVSDQCGSPTYAPHLAKAALKSLQGTIDLDLEVFPSGIYHLCNQGVTHWQEFALAILQEAAQKESALKAKHVQPILTEEYRTPAKRPLNSRLDTSKASQVLQIELPPWKEGLQDCLEQKYGKISGTNA